MALALAWAPGGSKLAQAMGHSRAPLALALVLAVGNWG